MNKELKYSKMEWLNNAVAKEFNFKPEMVKKRNRKQVYVKCRTMVYAIYKELNINNSYAFMGEFYGQGHCSVMHCVNHNHPSYMESDPKYPHIYRNVKNEFLNRENNQIEVLNNPVISDSKLMVKALFGTGNGNTDVKLAETKKENNKAFEKYLEKITTILYDPSNVGNTQFYYHKSIEFMEKCKSYGEFISISKIPVEIFNYFCVFAEKSESKVIFNSEKTHFKIEKSVVNV